MPRRCETSKRNRLLPCDVYAFVICVVVCSYQIYLMNMFLRLHILRKYGNGCQEIRFFFDVLHLYMSVVSFNILRRLNMLENLID